jgi:REP element-mobilizing transposase RayT
LISYTPNSHPPTDMRRVASEAAAMTSARSHLVDPAAPGFYHCVSRCVRRAFLCGEDGLSGRSFEHRKQWVEDRLLELAELFAVGVYAYAVMSNHLHVVVYVDPAATLAWSPDEVAQRWVRLTPVRLDGEIDEAACEARAAALASNAERIAVLRARLGSLSWFMRFLNEPIARRANCEDDCTGHFWEARFMCQALLDDAAVLACMAYVDLNPIRAGLAADLLGSPHTSVQRRLADAAPVTPSTPLEPIAGQVAPSAMPATLAEYLELTDWTGRIARPDKRGVIAPTAPPLLHRLGLAADQWHGQATGIEQRYWRAVGAVDALVEKARAMGQCWLKGAGRPAVRMPTADA